MTKAGNEMPSMPDATLEYVLSQLRKAEQTLIKANEEAMPKRTGYMGFELALRTLQECQRAVAEGPTQDAHAVLLMLDKAMETLRLTGGGDASPSITMALGDINDAAAKLRPKA